MPILGIFSPKTILMFRVGLKKDRVGRPTGTTHTFHLSLKNQIKQTNIDPNICAVPLKTCISHYVLRVTLCPQTFDFGIQKNHITTCFSWELRKLILNYLEAFVTRAATSFSWYELSFISQVNLSKQASANQIKYSKRATQKKTKQISLWQMVP